MANNIKCPNCGHQFDVENVIAADLEQKYKQQYQNELQKSLTSVEEDKKNYWKTSYVLKKPKKERTRSLPKKCSRKG